MENARAICEMVLRAMSKRGILKKDLPAYLNRHLSDEDSIPSNRSGVVQVSRWLNTESDKWISPRANVVLAMQEFLKIYR